MTTDELRRIVAGSAWLTRVLATVRAAGPAGAWVGAGVLRDLVWGRLYGSGFEPAEVRDVDVVFFDPWDLRRARDDAATLALCEAWPAVPWEAKNQAAVHTWFPVRFGGEPVAAFGSVEEAVATWPETATAVAVRLGGAGEIEVCAPLGLGDLLGGVWRRNPVRVSEGESLSRLARHAPGRRWPGVRIIEPGSPTS
ncbi:nucleotidyltransferase family protein [Longispora urticae]